MKVGFVWSVVTEAEIPDDEVLAIKNSDCHYLDKGDKFAELANKYGALPKEEGEITDVHNIDALFSDEEIVW